MRAINLSLRIAQFITFNIRWFRRRNVIKRDGFISEFPRKSYAAYN